LEYFQFLFDQGPRVGEVAALKWEKVDLEGTTATIDRSYSPSDAKDKTTKTCQRRVITLTDVVITQLKALRVRQKKDAFKRGGKPPVYVFTNRRGSPRRQDATCGVCSIASLTDASCWPHAARLPRHLRDDSPNRRLEPFGLGERPAGTREGHHDREPLLHVAADRGLQAVRELGSLTEAT
jgi:integrase